MALRTLSDLPDPYTELVAAETALRTAIRLALRNDWQRSFTADEIKKLEDKRTEEAKRRDGVTVSQDLLDYTEVYHFEKIIIKDHWEKLKPILNDQQRTKVYLGIIADVRNSIAHSRPVIPAERLLLAGAAGQIQNQLATYRNKVDGPHQHYASIDSARDSFGNNGDRDVQLRPQHRMFGASLAAARLEVGDEIIFELAATDPRGRDLIWKLYALPDKVNPMFVDAEFHPLGTATGARVRMGWRVSDQEVGEERKIVFTVENSGRYHRHRSWDDACMFYYAVNPPSDA